MEASLENLGTLERRLSVAVPMAEIEKEVDARLKRLTRTVKMAGFRPGKVPLKVVERQYGPHTFVNLDLAYASGKGIALTDIG